ncbi:MAG: hypothetical protein ACREYB_07785, partial [Casimicrobiaceae bacterium]
NSLFIGASIASLSQCRVVTARSPARFASHRSVVLRAGDSAGQEYQQPASGVNLTAVEVPARLPGRIEMSHLRDGLRYGIVKMHEIRRHQARRAAGGLFFAVRKAE